MNKKIYEKPFMKGHKLQHHADVLDWGSIEKDANGMGKSLYVPEDQSSEKECVEYGW